MSVHACTRRTHMQGKDKSVQHGLLSTRKLLSLHHLTVVAALHSCSVLVLIHTPACPGHPVRYACHARPTPPEPLPTPPTSIPRAAMCNGCLPCARRCTARTVVRQLPRSAWTSTRWSSWTHCWAACRCVPYGGAVPLVYETQSQLRCPFQLHSVKVLPLASVCHVFPPARGHDTHGRPAPGAWHARRRW